MAYLGWLNLVGDRWLVLVGHAAWQAALVGMLAVLLVRALSPIAVTGSVLPVAPGIGEIRHAATGGNAHRSFRAGDGDGQHWKSWHGCRGHTVEAQGADRSAGAEQRWWSSRRELEGSGAWTCRQ